MFDKSLSKNDFLYKYGRSIQLGLGILGISKTLVSKLLEEKESSRFPFILKFKKDTTNTSANTEKRILVYKWTTSNVYLKKYIYCS
jgi:hypothetical protein